MESRLFGSTGADLPVVGQGTWEMERDARAAVAALRRGLDLGMTHVDTAEMYGSGRVEEIVGEALAGRRDGVFLVSKVLPTHASYEGTLAACEGSLKRLKTDRLDLYLLHWPGSEPLQETIRAFEKLKKDGKIRHFGVSNFDVKEMEEAVSLSKEVACNQVLYHLGERAIEHAVLSWCEKHKIAVVAYSPLGQGKLPQARALSEVAQAHHATPAQVSLAFLARRTFVIPKASRITHVEENAAAADLKLTAADVEVLNATFPLGSSRALPTL